MIGKLDRLITDRRPEAVRKSDLEILSQIEAEQGKLRGVEEFKFATNAEMLAAIHERKRSETPAKV